MSLLLIIPVQYELIETLWNVNFVSLSAIKFGTLELIETLWNVNESY